MLGNNTQEEKIVAKTQELPSITSRPFTYIHKIPILKTKLFWDKLKEGEIYATKCKTCGKLYYPPQADCPKCLKFEVEWVKLGETAVLEAFTRVHAKPQGFNHYEPYIIAVATTPEGVRIMGWLEDVQLEDVKVGMKLNIKTRTSQDGYVIIRFGNL